jgi:Cof subfamily protein (haloacid dehalogenase superfamily)
MTVPIICFDLDGTLVDEYGRIHPADIDVLVNTKDVLFIPCTGRPMDSVVAMFHSNGLFQDAPIPFPTVVQNGSSVYKPGEEILFFNFFPKDVQQQMINYFDQYPEISFMLMEKDRTLLMHPNDVGIYWMNRFTANWEECDEKSRNNDIGKATCISDDKDVHAELTNKLKQMPLEIGVSMSAIYDINPKGISKRSGVLSVMEHLGLSGSPVFAAGDGENDLELFSLARATFSPATAPAHIQAKSDYVVDMAQNGILTKMLQVAGSI